MEVCLNGFCSISVVVSPVLKMLRFVPFLYNMLTNEAFVLLER